MLPFDAKYLDGRGVAYEVIEESGMTCLVLADLSLPEGLEPRRIDLLIRLPTGYPDLAPDMWWVEPRVANATGATIPGTESAESHLGRTWQRWSRHFDAGQWQPDNDSLETFIALIHAEFQRAAQLRP